MTVVDSAAGELASAGSRARRRRTRGFDGALVVGLVVVLQVAWLGMLAYGAYVLVS